MPELLYFFTQQPPLWLLKYSEISTEQIPLNWILAGALIVLLVGLIFEQVKKIIRKVFKIKNKKK